MIRVDFEWGTDIYLARQVVTERLQTVRLPAGVTRPELGPIGSVMGQIAFVALTSENVDPMQLRGLAETLVRRSLLAVPGISQVVAIGGDRRQYLVEVDPAALAQTGVSVDALVQALEAASGVPAAGFHVDGGQEYLSGAAAAPGLRMTWQTSSCESRGAGRSSWGRWPGCSRRPSPSGGRPPTVGRARSSCRCKSSPRPTPST